MPHKGQNVLIEALRAELALHHQHVEQYEIAYELKVQEALACGLEEQSAEFHQFIKPEWVNL